MGRDSQEGAAIRYLGIVKNILSFLNAVVVAQLVERPAVRTWAVFKAEI